MNQFNLNQVIGWGLLIGHSNILEVFDWLKLNLVYINHDDYNFSPSQPMNIIRPICMKTFVSPCDNKFR